MSEFKVEKIRSFNLCPRVEELLLKRDDAEISLRVFLPAMFNENEMYPAVVSARGLFGPFGGQDISRALSLGIVAFSFTSTERGEDRLGSTYRDDFHAILKYVHSLPYIRKDNIGIVSFSGGCIPTAACLAEYPDDPPIKYWIDGEGPSDRYVICAAIAGSEAKIRGLSGNEMAIKDWGHDLGDDDFWMPREAFRYMGKVKCRYLRLQAEIDHNQNWFYGHAIHMLNAAVRGGLCPWTRCNSGPVNVIHQDNKTLDLLPGRINMHGDRFIRYLAEMIRTPP